jgi:superfamily II DNA or RNA helicase
METKVGFFDRISDGIKNLFTNQTKSEELVAPKAKLIKTVAVAQVETQVKVEMPEANSFDVSIEPILVESVAAEEVRIPESVKVSTEVEEVIITPVVVSPVQKITAYPTISSIPAVALPKALRTPFLLNVAKFTEFQQTLRTHQNEALYALQGFNIGQINLPTGTGKTYVQKHIHVEDMLAKTQNNQTGVYVIAAHRLALCTQLFNEILGLVIPCGIKADMLYVGSDRYNFDALNQKYQDKGFAIAGIDGNQTTSSFTVAEKVAEAQAKGFHTIIVSTYHSFHRLEKLSKIDICTFDEAHTTTEERFTENINLIKPIIEKQYFFTATRKVFGTDGGQNDFDFYGNVLYEMSPKEAIELGEIVRPRIHAINTDISDVSEIDSDNMPMMVKTITEAFLHHKAKVKEFSADPNNIGAKLLVTVNGLKELHGIHGDESFRAWCSSDNVNTFAFSSDAGDFYNFQSCSRQYALEKMNELKNNEEAILFHYDILTEGIDLPAITGVLVLRDLPTAKLLQNIGRGARLLKSDRIKLYADEFKPHEVTKMTKPYCWVIIPEYLATLKGKEVMKRMIKDIRDEYNIQLELMGEDDQALADKEHFATRVTEKDSPDHASPVVDLQHIFEDILIEEFKVELSKQQDPRKYLEENLALL